MTAGTDIVARLSFDKMFALEDLGGGKFRSAHVDNRARRVFGGQLLGQALVAALRTVDPGRPAHAYQVQFRKPGLSDQPFDYAIEVVADGRSFSSRQISCSQGGEIVLLALASFHVPEQGLEFAIAMPQVPPPEDLRSEQQLRAEFILAEGGYARKARAMNHLAFEMRPVFVQNPVRPKVISPIQHFWVRPFDPAPPGAAERQGMVAYLSDIMFLSTALHQHGIHWLSTPMDWASLNHSLWLHGPVDFSEWLLWNIEAVWTGSSRAMTRGNVFTRDGRLVASAGQEGLMRMKADTKSHTN